MQSSRSLRTQVCHSKGRATVSSAVRGRQLHGLLHHFVVPICLTCFIRSRRTCVRKERPQPAKLSPYSMKQTSIAALAGLSSARRSVGVQKFSMRPIVREFVLRRCYVEGRMVLSCERLSWQCISGFASRYRIPYIYRPGHKKKVDVQRRPQRNDTEAECIIRNERGIWLPLGRQAR